MRAAARRIDRVNDWLHVGGAIPPEEYDRFGQAGITHVVDLREENEADPARLEVLGITRRHVPVPDRGAPTMEQLTEVVTWFDEQNGESAIYVHCGGGFGRAATMAVALLVQQGNALEMAVEQVRAARPEIRLNDDQLAWLRAVEKEQGAGA
jgi:protein-tyrosine phosphatase